MNISQSKAEQFLIKDCQNYANYVDNPSYVPQTKALNSNQRDALISFAFNCGAGNLKKLCNRALHEIPDAMLLYNKANGKVLVGLTRRRKAERSLFLKPIKESYNMMTIRKGSRGKSVKIWQIIVDVEPDGIFGAGTKKATENFQKRNGLTVDGIVGNSTWKAGLDIV
jgi:peptidoglycan hydrolase-like protein with peptidoglycan-binding domain